MSRTRTVNLSKLIMESLSTGQHHISHTWNLPTGTMPEDVIEKETEMLREVQEAFPSNHWQAIDLLLNDPDIQGGSLIHNGWTLKVDVK